MRVRICSWPFPIRGVAGWVRSYNAVFLVVDHHCEVELVLVAAVFQEQPEVAYLRVGLRSVQDLDLFFLEVGH